jgi:hypothetical protein
MSSDSHLKIREKGLSEITAGGDDLSVSVRENALKFSDDALLADLGYKQVFKREFTPLEVSVIEWQRVIENEG